ncbi:hypothetical protein H310_00303 [Aphanomyces invadans]|uniref:Uncharacterized protein n=1 Tax=Aphanomyces invadans TaxID=157072 RepID=A0A024UV90_9STRA|nr:hypothetical protein H310_00303 [Aphanomyces invadans]ETW09847.1 hypothetical protein H310_00303 [Aphanomyces invadans]|eukprot:XP_008861258.1 hypothetical protein H310_00303 [Aphanomyces invadans]
MSMAKGGSSSCDVQFFHGGNIQRNSRTARSTSLHGSDGAWVRTAEGRVLQRISLVYRFSFWRLRPFGPTQLGRDVYSASRFCTHAGASQNIFKLETDAMARSRAGAFSSDAAMAWEQFGHAGIIATPSTAIKSCFSHDFGGSIDDEATVEEIKARTTTLRIVHF